MPERRYFQSFFFGIVWTSVGDVLSSPVDWISGSNGIGHLYLVLALDMLSFSGLRRIKIRVLSVLRAYNNVN
jgi:hypothetical protein